jgi:hypothetical protein
MNRLLSRWVTRFPARPATPAAPGAN